LIGQKACIEGGWASQGYRRRARVERPAPIDSGLLRTGRSQPLVHSGLCGRLLAGIALWLPARGVALRPHGGGLGRRRGLSLAIQNARPGPLARAMKWGKCAFCKRAAPALTDPHRGAAGPRGDLRSGRLVQTLGWAVTVPVCWSPRCSITRRAVRVRFSVRSDSIISRYIANTY